MNEPIRRPKPTAAFPTVFCPRLERKLPVDEHADCPWCFGTRPQVSRGERSDFCEWKPGRDPVNFGFPPDATRHRSA